MVSPTVWPALVAGVGLVFFQQFTGQPSVLYYMDNLFQELGIDSFASVVLSSWKFVATMISVLTVDIYGRKVLLYIGCSFMMIGLVAYIVSSTFDPMGLAECNATYEVKSLCDASSCQWDIASCALDTCNLNGYASVSNDVCPCCTVGDRDNFTPQRIAILISLSVYITGYQIGFGPIVWLIISEMFPLEIRGKAISLSVVINFTANALVSFLLPIEMILLQNTLTFSCYAVLLLWSAYFIYAYVPETKGLTLEQIEEHFLSNARRGFNVNVNGGVVKENEIII